MIRFITRTILLLFVSFSGSKVNATQLNGSYTIDPAQAATATNFKNFSSAVTYLTGSGARSDAGPSNAAPFGISGPVIFNAAAATYTELVAFNTAIAGLSSANTISFNGAGQTTTIIQGANASTASGGVLTMATVSPRLSNIKFNNIGFVNTGVGSVTYLTDADNIRFNSCRFSSGFTQGYILSFGGTNPTTDSVTNCTFLNGTEAIRFFDATLNTGAHVQGNIITGALNRGILGRGINGGKILDNTVQIGTTATPAIYGIYLYAPTASGAEVSRNKVTGSFSQAAINIDPGNAAGNRTISTNNSIILTGTAQGSGMVVGGNFSEIYHNSITVSNTNTSSAGFNLSTPAAGAYSNTKIQNNIVQNTGGGYCISTSTATFNSTIINFNDYYYSGAFCTKNNTTNLSLTGWKAIADANSKNIFAEISADGYTHGNACLTTTNSTTATNDIVGTIRSLTAPTMGAFEVITPFANNASMDSVLSISSPVSSNTNLPLIFRIRNTGSAAISTFNATFRINGGPITTETFAAAVNTCDTARFTFVAPINFNSGANQIKVYITGVNGGADANPIGDTITVNINATLNGTYTINPAGGITPANFTSFNNAVSALTTYGVSGPVTFNVSPGTYSENIVVPAFTGMGVTNPVVFRPANNIAGSVVISALQNIAANAYAVRLNATNNISFKKINVVYQNTGSTSLANYGFYINNSKNITIDSCTVKDNYAPDQTITYSIYSVSSNTCTFSNNYISKQYQALSSTSDTALQVINNRTVKNNITAFSFSGYRNLTVDKNYIDSNVVNTGTSVSFNPSGAVNGTCRLTGNTLVGAVSNSITITNAHTVTDPLLIANNFIAYPVLLSSTGYIKLHHNTFLVKGSYAITMSGTATGSEIKNNIFQVSPDVTAPFFGTINASGLTFLNNNYNAYNGTVPTYYSTVTALEPAAAFERVIFPNDKSPQHYNSCGLSVAQLATVTNDYFGNTRSATTTKGAVEVNGVNNDAAVIALLFPAAVVPESTPATLRIRVKNYGLNIINTITLRYSINGAVPVEESFSTTLNPCDTTSLIFSSTPSFANISSIKFYPQQVNGVADAVNANDTLTATISTMMSGVYTINVLGAGPRNYKTFGEADTAMINRSLAGAVTFNVADGTYTEGALVFSKTKISGTSTTNTITFQGNNTDSNFVVLGSSATNLSLDSMSNITFRKMRINKKITLGPGNCGNITIENCRLGAGMATVNQFNDPASIDSNIFIRNNTFEGGLILSPNVSPLNNSTALYFAFPKGIVIEGNQWLTSTTGGIILDYVTAPIIRNNLISGIGTGGLSLPSNYAIIVSRFKDSVVITGNTILGYSIAGVSLGGLGTLPAYAIRLQGATGGSAKGIVANNYVQTGNIGLGLGVTNSDGVLPLTDVYNLKVYHNTFRMESNSSSLTSLYGGKIVDLSQSSTDFRNNIISLKYTGAGVPLAGSGIGLITSPINNFTNQNFNSYYTDYPVHGFSSIAAPSVSNVNFTAWKMAGRDVNGYFVSPKFNSTLADFHPQQGLIMNGGTPLADITTDIEVQPRSASTPDIGCDEFDLPGADAGVLNYVGPAKPFTAGLQPVVVKIKNYGVANLTSVQINWKVNGITQLPYSWTGALAYDSTSANIAIGNYNFSAGVAHSIVCWTSLPNTYNDTLYVNDTLKVNNVYAALNGIYTLGGTTPDFVNFAATTTTLFYGGVLGPVTFRIRNGTYVENVTLKEYMGVNAVNNIIYESESGDSSLVLLKWVNNFSNTKHTVLLDSADFYTFRKMSIRFEGSGNGSLYAVALQNGASSNSIQNCVVSCDASNSTVINDNNTLSANYNSNLLIKNNVVRGNIPFTGGGGSGTLRSLGLRIENNNFEAMSGGGLSISTYRGFVFTGNTFKNGTGTALALASLDSTFACTKNKIYGGFTTAINASTVSGTIANPANISNNMFTTTGNAIIGSSVNYWNFYHNSIKSIGNNAINISTSTNIILRNNSLQSNTVALNFAGTTTLVSNFNNLFTPGSNLVTYNSTTYTFNTWKAFGQDINSISILPVFMADSNLHLLPAFPYFNKKGTPLASVTDDIDGDVRDVALPDIGADEYSPILNDASPFRILSPLAPFIAGTYPVQIRIRNLGGTNLTTATVKWYINGVAQPDFNFTGNLVTGDSATITLGNYTFNNYGGDSLLVITSLPNAVTDENQINDTIGRKIYPALCGVYTVAGVSPSFATVHDAVVALNNGGVTCAVIFNIRSGVYFVNDTISTVLGGSIINSVTFKSENNDSSAVTLQTSCSTNSPGIFYLNGVNNINFKNLGFKRISNQAGVCSNLGIIASNFNVPVAGRSEISNNWFQGSQYANYAAFSFGNDSLVVQNNRADSATLLLISNAGYARIINNTLLVGSISIQAPKIVMQGNSIDSGHIIISKTSGTDSCFILNNTISRSVSGMQVSGFTRGQISKSKIAISGNGTAGLQVSNTSDALGNLQIDNNFISIASNYPGTLVSGITPGTSGQLYNSRIWNNSVNILNTNSGSRAMHMYFFNGTQIKNNSFVNSGGGYALYMNNSLLTAADTLNYNNYYTTGTNLAFYNSANRINLALLKTATGKDSRSVNGLPVYASTTDLHSNSSDLNNAGGVIPQIITDIDNEVRSAATPDIGADEFNLTSGNLIRLTNILSHHIDSLTPANPTSSVSFRFKNMSNVAITNASFKLNINGADAGTVTNFSGSLNPGDTTGVLSVGTFNFKVDSSYNIAVISTTSGDGLAIDDTIRVLNKYAAYNGTYTVEGIAPDVKTLQRLLRSLERGGYSGNTVFNIRSGNYSDTLTIVKYRTNNPSATVTFTSEAADSSLVSISGNSAGLPVLNLEKAQNIIIKKLGFSSALSNGLMSLSATKNVTIENCAFNGSTSGISTHFKIATGGSSADTNLIIGRNYFNSITLPIDITGYEIYQCLACTDFINVAGLVIEQNRMVNTTGDIAIVVKSADLSQIKNNEIDAGLSVDFSTSPNVTGNKIIVKAKPLTGFNLIGAKFTRLNGSLIFPVNIINNAMVVDGTRKLVNGNTISFTGMNVNECTYTNIYNNTISTFNGDSVTTGLRVFNNSNSASNIDIRNNNVAALCGRAIDWKTTNINTSNYNNFYVADSAIIGKGNGAYYNTFAQWQTANPAIDINSISVDPAFMGVMGYRPLNTLMDNKGTPLSMVLFDLDSLARHATTPDIGCLEFGPIAKDLQMVKLASPLPYFPEGNNPVKIILRNNGSTTITSATIKWKMDGVAQPNFNWSGSLPITASDTILLGNYNFAIKTDNDIEAWIENPNNTPDNFTGNDTLRKTLWCALNRTYIYNQGSPLPGDDFNDATQLTNQLYNGGVAAPAIIKIRNEQNLIPLYIGRTPGTSIINTLTFEPLNNKLDSVRFMANPLSGLADNFAVRLDNSKYVRFRKIRFENINVAGTYTNNISMYFGCKNISFDSCRFVAKIGVDETAAINNQCNLIQAQSTDSITVNNCIFLGGGYAINTGGIDWASNRQKGLIITGSGFANQTMGTINAINLDAFNISFNNISNTIRYKNFRSIYLENTNTAGIIKNNKINIPGDGVGLYVNYYGNYADEIQMPFGQRPIQIVNNFVQIGDTAAVTRGIYIHGAIGLYHNTIHVTSNNSNAVALEYSPIYGASNNYLEMLNNIYAVNGPGICIKTDEVTSPGHLPTSDYNDLYTLGTYVARWGNNFYAARTNWFNATTHDLHSVSANPVFWSNTNLHARSQFINNAALPIAGIDPLDIDGEGRSNTTPDIGADEFYTANTGISELVSPKSGCGLSNAEPIVVKVKNYGFSAQGIIPVAYRINNAAIINDTIITAINAGDSLIYAFPVATSMNLYGSYKVEVWSNIPGDSLVANDTTVKFIYSTPLINTFPYANDFEVDNGNWFTDGANSSWQWGVIHSGTIDTASSGTKGWKTNLVGSYKNNELSYFQSPCFDLSGFASKNPWLYFSHAYQLETGVDKSWMEYSTDAGNTWTKLGASGQGQSWYNNATEQVWDNVNAIWHMAGIEIPVNIMTNKTAVRFRFVLQTNGNTIYDGVAVDDIFIDSTANTFCQNSIIKYSAGVYNAVGYQWQKNDGSGFVNIVNDANYAGANNVILTINNLPGTATGTLYRCMINTGSAIVYSTPQTLRFINKWTGNINTDWFNAGNWSCGGVPDEYSDVIIPGNRTHYPLVTINAAVRKITLSSGAIVTIAAGVNFEARGK